LIVYPSRFKTGPRSSSSSQHKITSLATGLSPLSKLVYDQATIPFRYPTPETPGTMTPSEYHTVPRASVSKAASPVVPKGEQLKQSSAASKNKQAHARNTARLEIVLPTKSQLEQQSADRVKSSSSPTSTVITNAPPQASPQLNAQQPLPSQPPIVSAQGASVDHLSPITPNRPPARTQPNSGSQKTAIAVELPRATSFNKSEFLVVADEPDEPINL